VLPHSLATSIIIEHGDCGTSFFLMVEKYILLCHQKKRKLFAKDSRPYETMKDLI
jgi:hypothetical protein